jgi:hypothetical protein
LEVRVVLGEFSNERLGFEIPDSDSRLSGSAQPVSGRGESQGIDGISSFEGVQVLSFREIPKSNSSVLSSRSTERTVRRDSGRVYVSSVTNEVSLELAVSQVPDLDELVPTSRDDGRVLSVRGESDAGNPFSVSLFVDGVLAFSEGVP